MATSSSGSDVEILEEFQDADDPPEVNRPRVASADSDPGVASASVHEDSDPGVNRPTVILDNGGGNIKVGFVTPGMKQSGIGSTFVLTVPNAIGRSNTGRRTYTSNQIYNCLDTSGMHMTLPFQKGYMTGVDTQKVIWDHIFGSDGLGIDFSECDLIFTEPFFNFHSIKKVTNEIFLEDYGFHAICRAPAAQLAEYTYAKEMRGLGTKDQRIATLVVDSGHSFTHVAPLLNGEVVTDAVRRIDMGGKALTNQLKEIVSYRQLNVMDEYYLMNQVKEDVCYVSADLHADMKEAKLDIPLNSIYREYIMPDFTTPEKCRGRLRTTEELKTRTADQILKLNNERFSVPELLFHPSDVGLNQAGIPELIHEVIKTFPEWAQPDYYKNILLIGGNAKLPGFRDRIYKDLRPLAPYDFEVEVYVTPEPDTMACHGGGKIALNGQLAEFMVTRQRYEEEGERAFDKYKF